MLLLLVCPALAQESADVTFKSGVSNVRVDAQVVQDGQVITDLTAQDFVVREDGKPQPIVYFGHEKEQLSLLLLFDVSGSMRKYVEEVAAVARQSLRYLRVKDRVAVMVFARDAHVRLDFTDDMPKVADEIREAASDESVGTATNINDALLTAAQYMEEKSGEVGRKALLILTDNMGLNYKSPDPPVIAALHATSTVMNAIVVGKGRRPNPESAGRTLNPDFTPPNVFIISEQTGGEAVSSDEAGRAFNRMIERIRTRYSIHYKQPESGNTGFRKIEVELTPAAKLRYPRAQVNARKGYRVGGLKSDPKQVK
jgi:Ca-activated chloride channel homolog